MKFAMWCAALAMLSACGSQGAGTGTAEATSGAESTTDTFGIANAARPEPRLLTAGQPTPAQLDAARAGGVRTVITLRAPDEPGQQWEADALMTEGVRFLRIPVRGPDDLTEENARRLDAALVEALAEEGDVLLHCGSSNRVGALMALRAFFVQGKSAEEALAIGRAAGLTRLEPHVHERLRAACESLDRC